MNGLSFPGRKRWLCFKKAGQEYKVELIEDLPEDVPLSIYRQGDFVDLCMGPHLPSTGRLKSVKLMSVAGAYWRGSEKNKMLQRIYGTSFPKRVDAGRVPFPDWRRPRSGTTASWERELDLFSILDEGPGFPFFHPKGWCCATSWKEYWREEHKKRGYQEIRTPIMLSRDTVGAVRPLGPLPGEHVLHQDRRGRFRRQTHELPGRHAGLQEQLHSYRELPIRMAELGLVHRHELSGALHGLMRVRCFTQDDAHIFMLPAQVKDEITA